MNERPARWKRSVLFLLSMVLIVAAMIGGFTQSQHHWTSDWVWLVIVLLCAAGVCGLAAAVFGSDRWVARVLGGA